MRHIFLLLALMMFVTVTTSAQKYIGVYSNKVTVNDKIELLTTEPLGVVVKTNGWDTIYSVMVCGDLVSEEQTKDIKWAKFFGIAHMGLMLTNMGEATMDFATNRHHEGAYHMAMMQINELNVMEALYRVSLSEEVMVKVLVTNHQDRDIQMVSDGMCHYIRPHHTHVFYKPNELCAQMRIAWDLRDLSVADYLTLDLSARARRVKVKYEDSTIYVGKMRTDKVNLYGETIRDVVCVDKSSNKIVFERPFIKDTVHVCVNGTTYVIDSQMLAHPF